jgi:hypothetical protein
MASQSEESQQLPRIEETPRWFSGERRQEFVRGFLLALAGFTLVLLCGLLSNGGRRISSAQQSEVVRTPVSVAISIAAATSVPEATPVETHTAVPTVSPTPALPTPTALPAPTVQVLALSEAELLEIAEGSVGSSTLRDQGLPAGQWQLRLGDTGRGPEAEVMIPLIQAKDNAEFVRLAQKRIVQVVSNLFLAEPNLARVRVTGTFPWGGLELPAMTMAIPRSAATDWANVNPDALETIAEDFEISPFYQQQ